MDLRKIAEERAIQTKVSQLKPSYSRSSSARKNNDQSLFSPADSLSSENLTPHFARIAEKDYLINGSRARAESDDFIPPRWVPDLAVNQCYHCHVEFDWINRRHHCRHCGNVFCETCTAARLLIPPEFGYRDPERVCLSCRDKLLPMQMYLSTNIANHQRVNMIDIASDTCNVRRYFNMPYASTLGSEIRKAAYTVYNLLGPQTIRDRAIPLRFIKQAKGLAFITVMKGGMVFTGKLGKQSSNNDI
jgi:hypothetical protein